MNTTEAKLAALRAALTTSPEYAEIIPFFIAIQEYLLGRELTTGITANVAASPKERNQSGFPLLSPTDLEVNHEQARHFLAGLVAVIKANSREPVAGLDTLATALATDQLDPAPLFRAILERQRPPLDETAAALEVPAPLIEFLCEVPLRTMLERLAEPFGPDDVAGWQEGFCPICGSRAGMAELAGEEGKRYLACSACSFTWLFSRIKCPYCGCEEPDKLSYFTVDDGPVRVDTCKGCSRYIKTRDSRKGDSDVPLEVRDALTMHLDLMASREGFERGK